MKPRVLLLLSLLASLALPGAAHASTAMCNVPIKTGDGIVLRANLWLPRRRRQGARPSSRSRATTRTRPTRPGRRARARAASRRPTRRSPTRATRSCSSTIAAPARARASGTRGASARSSTTATCSTGSRRSRGRTARSATTGGSYMGITSLLVAEADAARVTCRQAARGQGDLGRRADVRRLPRRDVPRRRDRRGLHPAVARADDTLSRCRRRPRPATRPARRPTWADHLRERLRFRGAQKIVDTTLGDEGAYDGDVLPPALARRPRRRRSASRS